MAKYRIKHFLSPNICVVSSRLSVMLTIELTITSLLFRDGNGGLGETPDDELALTAMLRPSKLSSGMATRIVAVDSRRGRKRRNGGVLHDRESLFFYFLAGI